MFKNLSQLLVLWKLPFRDKVRVDLASFFIKSSEILLVSIVKFWDFILKKKKKDLANAASSFKICVIGL